MRFLCVVLLVTSLIAIGKSLVQPSMQPATAIPSVSICQVDWECQPHCFCYKENQYQQRGQCVCTMDLKLLNECTEDKECQDRDTQKGRHKCDCHRDSSLQPTGQCECINPIG